MVEASEALKKKLKKIALDCAKIAFGLSVYGAIYLACCIIDPDPEKTKKEKQQRKKEKRKAKEAKWTAL